MAANEWVTLRRELPWREPVDGAVALAGLLLDGPGAHPDARRSFIGMAPLWEARCTAGTWSRTWSDGRRDTPSAGLEGLRELCALPEIPGHGFEGGIIGYLGYEAAHLFDETLPAGKPRTTPDVVLRLCRDAVVLDRGARTVELIVHDADEETAQARLEAHAAAWDAAAPVLAAASPGHWATSLCEVDFCEAVDAIRALILDGDLFQANLATCFEAPCDAAPESLFARFVRDNPSPYMALLDFGDHAIVSNSPEQLLAIEGNTIRTRPIAGTRGRGLDAAEDDAREADLRGDSKEQAEHTMLVDLLRNDIAKVALPGTTHVAEAMSVERYRNVMHLVSEVRGTLRPGVDAVDALGALFPGGTITGAPKHRAIQRIDEFEPVARGPYTGSAGFIAFGGDSHWNILIRTLVLQDGVARVHAGSGIVADSVSSAEWKEAGRKAASLLRTPELPATRLGDVTRIGSWHPAKAPGQVTARVLLVDNYDSFVHNLADACAMLGADTVVRRNDEALPEDVTHIILGPGPGWPADSGATMDVARRLPDVPILGVCLGHQALAEAHGGDVHVVPAVHGKAEPVHHDGHGLFVDVPSPFLATRYHSLAVTPPPNWTTEAWLDDGTVMAMRHPERPIWGVQFHPESFCTEGGLHILHRFLK